MKTKDIKRTIAALEQAFSDSLIARPEEVAASTLQGLSHRKRIRSLLDLYEKMLGAKK